MIRCLEEIVSNPRWSEYFMDITLKSWYIKKKRQIRISLKLKVPMFLKKLLRNEKIKPEWGESMYKSNI